MTMTNQPFAANEFLFRLGRLGRLNSVRRQILFVLLSASFLSQFLYLTHFKQEGGYFNGNFSRNISWPPRPKPGNCAIIIYGTPRSFRSIVLPTFEHNVLRPNADFNCDYFVHSHLQDYDEVPLHPGKSERAHSDEIRDLQQSIEVVQSVTQGRAPHIHFVNTTNDECFRRRKDLFMKTHALKDNGGHWLYFPRTIRSWDGLEKAWQLMESTMQELQITYEQVAIFRSDVAYITPINIYDSPSIDSLGQRQVIIADVAADNNKIGSNQTGSYFEMKTFHAPSIDEINSYIAFGPYDALKIWATERFSRVGHFLTNLTKTTSEKVAIESKFVDTVILPTIEEFGFPVRRNPSICFLRVFPDGSVAFSDCRDAKMSELYLKEILQVQRELLYQHGRNEEDQAPDNSRRNSFDLFSSATENNTAVVCCIVQGEEMYLDEWLDYHLSIGFSHIYIYDNSDNFELGHNWLEWRPQYYNKVTLHSFPGRGRQWEAYQKCGEQYALNNGHRWVGFFDVDEFLVLHQHSDVVSFLLQHCKTGTVSLNWVIHSWNNRVQYSPEPVTKRFQGMSEVNQHVKSISNVKHINFEQPLHPHFATLKEGFLQKDTNGNKIPDRWRNLDYPNDVASFYHHQTKSWKEHIVKRMRGRVSVSSDQIVDSTKQLVKHAKQGGSLHNTSRLDPAAWEKLKTVNPKYQFFDSSDLHAAKHRMEMSMNMSVGICCTVSDQEAYIDEWVDYHLAAGFSAVYIYDSSEDFWMRQWGQERGETADVFVIHFPGNSSNPLFKARSYANCSSIHGMAHNALAFIDVNDFFIFPEQTGTNPMSTLLFSQPACAYQFQKIVFGHGGKPFYDPLPVAKRFMLRVEDYQVNVHPSLLLSISSVMKGADDMVKKLQNDFSRFLSSGKWDSSICALHETFPNSIVVYHYLLSTKECINQRENSTICNLRGTVEDQFGWEQLKYFLPAYSNYDGFL